MRVKIAETMGWSFEYIDDLGVQNISDISGVWSGTAKVEEFYKNRGKK